MVLALAYIVQRQNSVYVLRLWVESACLACLSTCLLCARHIAQKALDRVKPSNYDCDVWKLSPFDLLGLPAISGKSHGVVGKKFESLDQPENFDFGFPNFDFEESSERALANSLSHILILIS